LGKDEEKYFGGLVCVKNIQDDVDYRLYFFYVGGESFFVEK